MKNLKSAENSKNAIKNKDFCGWFWAPEGRPKKWTLWNLANKKHCSAVHDCRLRASARYYGKMTSLLPCVDLKKILYQNT